MTRLNLTAEEINIYFPVVGVTCYGRVLLLHRVCKLPIDKKGKKSNRKAITRVNRKSLDLLLYKVSTCGINWRSMLTLTYGQNYPVNGKLTKTHLNHFLVEAKRSFGELSYFWFLEFQTRGAPHMHLVWTVPAPGDCERELVATIWSKIVEPGNWPYTEVKSPYRKRDARFGMSTQDSVFRQHRRAVVWSGLRKTDGAIRYALMYAKKEAQKRVPENYRNVGRFWATSRDVKPPRGIEIPAKEPEIRDLLKAIGRDFGNWEVLPKFVFHSANLL